MPSALARSNSRPSSSSKMNSAAFSPRWIGRRRRIAGPSSDLPAPAGPRIRRARAALDAAAEELRPGRRCRWPAASRVKSRRCSAATRRGIDLQRRRCWMVKSWIAAAKPAAAILDDPQPPALGAVVGRQLLQPDRRRARRCGRSCRARRSSGRRAAARWRRAGRNSASAPGSAGGSAASSAPAGGSPTGCRCTTRVGSVRSTASKISRVVSPSSRSEE